MAGELVLAPTIVGIIETAKTLNFYVFPYLLSRSILLTFKAYVEKHSKKSAS